jgi:SAC3 domain-containing protein 1
MNMLLQGPLVLRPLYLFNVMHLPLFFLSDSILRLDQKCLFNSSHSRRRGQPVERDWRQHHNQGVWREVQEERRQESIPRGVCLSMCPIRELQDREAQNLLHRFEVLSGTERERWPRADPSGVVKEYARPAAGKDSTRPSDLRPPAVLLKTVFYLVDNIAASPTLRPWTEASQLH